VQQFQLFEMKEALTEMQKKLHEMQDHQNKKILEMVREKSYIILAYADNNDEWSFDAFSISTEN
jgi:hypothetical protein